MQGDLVSYTGFTDLFDVILVDNDLENNSYSIEQNDLEYHPIEPVQHDMAFGDIFSEVDISHILESNSINENNSIELEYPEYPPACVNFPGANAFDVQFESRGLKNNWMFSAKRQWLYANKDVSVPVNFVVKTPVPHGSKIRAMTFFSQSEFANDVVSCCPTHSAENTARGILESDFLLRCESKMAKYETINGIHTVVVPYESPPCGQQCSTFLYKFMCFSSCRPEKKHMKIIFVLELHNTILGQKCLDLKVCACPKRDCEGEENVIPGSSKQSIKKTLKPIKAEPTTTATIKIEDVDCFFSTLPAEVNSSGIHHPLSSHNWSGEYGFDTIVLSAFSKNHRFSSAMDKLYIVKDTLCAFQFTSTMVVPESMFVRATPLFVLPEHTNETIIRCPNHSREDHRAGLKEADHVIQCDYIGAYYIKDDESKIHSVAVPYYSIPGQTFSIYNFKFCCFGSCVGSLNRRPFMISFTLENETGAVLGRRSIDVKICASPHRDCTTDHNKSMKKNESLPKKPCHFPAVVSGSDSSTADDEPPKKKKKKSYVIYADDYEEFVYLRKALKAFRQRSSMIDQMGNNGVKET